MKDIGNLIRDNGDIISRYLSVTDTMAVLVLDESMRISYYNGCFENLVHPPSSLKGTDIFSILLPESQNMLPLSEVGGHLKIPLNFKDGDSSITLQCHIFRTEGNQHLIFGGRLMLSSSSAMEKMSTLTNEMANMARELHRKNKELEEAHSKIKILGGIIPICMHCKNIRDDKGYWDRLEEFISTHSEAQFSHCICPECVKKHYGHIQGNC